MSRVMQPIVNDMIYDQWLCIWFMNHCSSQYYSQETMSIPVLLTEITNHSNTITENTDTIHILYIPTLFIICSDIIFPPIF